MNILVLLKQTFDTEEKIVIQNGLIQEDGVEFIINPYDEYAVEEAIRLKEQHGGEVTLVTVGPDRAEDSLRTALAMGADRAILIQQPEVADEHVIASLITASIKDRPYDVILGGNMAVDSGAGQVAIRVAEQLGIPHVSTITKLNIEGGTATLERDVEGDLETVQVNLPFLATAQQGLNDPRYPSLPGIMKAKKKPVERVEASDLQLDATELTAKTTVIQQFLPAKKQAGRVLSGEISLQVSELVQMLRTEAKVL
ncbi:electron transfer flavoprotein subunit beta/FixA family protein [Brevibacillus choshinensis]|uniref:electron transfer flavoprotein subunit beta/FixA family protein n=1 Tax=Brevibacillus choshinensis TaxID=54911 RepID=UPI002E1B75C9|nr:electron transfer flavoprotein subunit beta/FixA family protein [Brevibacillus choshinensis]MED4753805.1 electron transfer flavoprotein subunit beta/FixA family protein [Brevibacillus choshinensis]MED4781763.1 electron transfer flavoprotein subunit beta/FixA family protein [Brevibacillus choshinensis]